MEVEAPILREFELAREAFRADFTFRSPSSMADASLKSINLLHHWQEEIDTNQIRKTHC